MNILWYISPVDGSLPWKETERAKVDHKHMRRLAQFVDSNGFYGALLGTYAHDVLITASTLLSSTQRMRFLIPIYPGVVPPALLAQQALTFDDYSGGRLLLNLVNGSDEAVRRYGITLSRDARYDMSTEYWRVFRRLYSGEHVVYTGQYFSVCGSSGKIETPTFLPLGPIQKPCIPLWGAGASEAGIKHAAQTVDVYLAFLQRPDKLKKQIETVRKAADKHGRVLRFGVLASVIVRNTASEAKAHFQDIMTRTGIENINRRLEAEMQQLGRFPGGINDLENDDPQIAAWLRKLKQNLLPTLEELEIAPNIYAGSTPWAALDVWDKGLGTYMVGNPEQIVKCMKALRDEIGVDTFIFSGWPLLDEAQHVSDLLLPLLKKENLIPSHVSEDLYA